MALLLGLPSCEAQEYLVKPLEHALVLGVNDHHDRILRANGESNAPAGEFGQAGSPIRLQRGLQILDDVDEFGELGVRQLLLVERQRQ